MLWKSLWGLLLIFYLITSCGGRSGSLLKMDEHDEHEGSEIFLPHKKNSKGIPNIPRRRLVREVQWYKKTKVTVGLKTSFAGNTFEALSEVEFEKNYSIIVWLFAPGEEDALATNGVSVYLNNSSTRSFSLVCRYSSYLSIDPSATGKISVFGNGLLSAKGMKEVTGVIQMSSPFELQVGQSWPSIYEKCRQYAEDKKLKQSMDRDLLKMTKGMIYHNSQNECVTDAHCLSWHDSALPSVAKWTKAECVRSKNNIRFCALRSIKGNSCPLYEKKSGRRLSQGYFEYPCAKKLKCVVTQKGGWFTNGEIYSYWKGQCK